MRSHSIAIISLLLGGCADPTGLDLGPFRRAALDVPGITTRLEVTPTVLSAGDSVAFKMWARNTTAERYDFVGPCGPPLDAVFSSAKTRGVSVVYTRSPSGVFTCQGYSVAPFDSLLVDIRIKGPTVPGTYQAVTGIHGEGGFSNLSSVTTFRVQ
jgi:hypothetical protein